MKRQTMIYQSILGLFLVFNLLPSVFCAEYDRETRFNTVAHSNDVPEEPIDPIYYKDALQEDDAAGRFFFTNGTLIPVTNGGALVVSTVGIVAVIIGGIILLLLLLSPHGLKGGLLSPLLNGYPSGSYYYPSPHSYYNYDYSKLGGYQSSSTSR